MRTRRRGELELLIVRHGESEGNRQRRMQGRLDYPLTERGVQQAEVLGEWLRQRGARWDAAYVSPLKRAAQTAEIVCRELEPAEPEPDLREIFAGEIEGLTREEMNERFPSFLQRGVTGLGDFGEYGGESYDDVQARVERLWAKIEERHREAEHAVLLVAHGGINFQLLKRLICSPVPRVCIVRFGNCSATLVRVRDRRGTVMGEVLWHVPVELMAPPGTVSTAEGSGSLFR